MSKSRIFMTAIAFQTLVLMSLFLSKALIVGGGTEIKLRVMPYPPGSFFRIDTLMLNYQISNFDKGFIKNKNIKNGDTIYVSLINEGEYWNVKSASLEKPSDNNEIFIKGKIIGGADTSPNDPSYYQYLGSNDVYVLYGIENYAVNEEKVKGTDLSMLNFDVIVSLDDQGNSVIKKVLVDNKPWP